MTLAIGALVYVIVEPYLMCTSWRKSHPDVLETGVSIRSPDGRLRFESERNGSIAIVSESTGKSVHEATLSPSTYSQVYAGWKGNKKVEITAKLRYGFKMSHAWIDWNAETGKISDHIWRD